MRDVGDYAPHKTRSLPLISILMRGLSEATPVSFGNPTRTTKLFRHSRTSPEIICLAMMMYILFSLSLCNVKEFLHVHGIDISYAPS